MTLSHPSRTVVPMLRGGAEITAGHDNGLAPGAPPTAVLPRGAKSGPERERASVPAATPTAIVAASARGTVGAVRPG